MSSRTLSRPGFPRSGPGLVALGAALTCALPACDEDEQVAPVVDAAPGSSGDAAPGDAASPDAAVAADAGPDAAGDGALVCNDAGPDGGVWFDQASQVCRACPAPAITCRDLLEQEATRLDPASGRLDLAVPAGRAALISGAATLYVTLPSVEGGEEPLELMPTPAVQAGRASLSLSPPFGLPLPPGLQVHGAAVSLTDACGTRHVVSGPGEETGAFLDFYLTPTDAGAPLVESRCISD